MRISSKKFMGIALSLLLLIGLAYGLGHGRSPHLLLADVGQAEAQGVDAIAGSPSAGALIASAQVASKVTAKIYKVTAFGAKGNGKADDTAAIQAAVNKAGANGGGTVYVPKGVYLVSSTILLNKDNVSLEGAGWNAELRITKHPRRVIEIRGSQHNAVRNLQVSLGVEGGVRNDEDEGIYVSSQASAFVIENVLGNRKGIMLRGQVHDGAVRNNTIRGTLADGIHITGASERIRVVNNDVSDTGDDAIAVVSYTYQNAPCQRIAIIGNRIRNSAARGITHAGGIHVEMLDNTIAGTASSGILTVLDTNYGTFEAIKTIIKGNQISNAGQYGVKVGNQFGIEIAPGSSQVNLVNNTVTDSYNRGISVVAENTLIKGNIVQRSGGSGLDLRGSGSTIADNRFEDNGSYGFVSFNSSSLLISGNSLLNNNEIGSPHIDNFLLEDSDHSVVKDNVSSETRDLMRVEHTYNLAGSCAGLVFDHNTGSGTLLGEQVSCKK